MNKVPSISIRERNNPDISVEATVSVWSQKHQWEFWNVGGNWRIDFKTDKDPEFAELEELLRRAQKEQGLVYNLWFHVDYDEDDIRAGDFVHIEGRYFVDKSKMKAFWNRDSLDFRPCTTCGFGISYYEYLTEPIVMSEGVFHAKIDRKAPPPEGWDIVCPGINFLIVSRKVVDALKNANARGLRLMPVISKETGKIWDQAAVLQADKSIMAGCEQHSPLSEGASFCRDCGRVVGTGGLYGPRYFRKRDVEDHEIITTKPNPSTFIYISQRLHKVLQELPTNGLQSVMPGMICDH